MARDVGGSRGTILQALTTDPGATSAGEMLIYAKTIAGRAFPKFIGPSGPDTVLQPALFNNNYCLWTLTAATAGIWQGTAGAGAGTFTSQLPQTTSIYASMKRARYANVVTTANQVLGQRNTEAMFFRGNVAGTGGFFLVARFGFDVWTNGGRLFAGMATATTVVSAEPSALANTCGFAIDSTDNGLIYFITRDGTTSNRVSTGLAAVTGKGYDVYIYCAPNGSTIYWRIDDLNAGTTVSGSTATNLPVATTLLTANVLASNAALTPVTSVQLGVNKIYVETDY